MKLGKVFSVTGWKIGWSIAPQKFTEAIRCVYHMVTGNVPFPGKNPSDVMHRHLKQELVPPDHINPTLSAGFSQIIEMMMAKEVSQRYQNASDLIEDLDAVARGDSPQFAQPTLDFAKLAEAAEASPASEPVKSTMHGGNSSGMESLYLPLLITSAIINVILLIIVVVTSL